MKSISSDDVKCEVEAAEEKTDTTEQRRRRRRHGVYVLLMLQTAILQLLMCARSTVAAPATEMSVLYGSGVPTGVGVGRPRPQTCDTKTFWICSHKISRMSVDNYSGI